MNCQDFKTDFKTVFKQTDRRTDKQTDTQTDKQNDGKNDIFFFLLLNIFRCFILKITHNIISFYHFTIQHISSIMFISYLN